MSGDALFADKLLKQIVAYHKRYANCAFKLRLHTLWALIRLSFGSRAYRSTKGDQLRLLFIIKGGLGDILIALNYLHHLLKQTEVAFAAEIAVREELLDKIRCFLHGHPLEKRIIPIPRGKKVVDCSVNIVRIPEILYADEEKLARLAPKFAAWVKVINKFQHDFYEIASSDYLIEQYTLLCGRTRLGEPNIDDYVQLTDDFRINLPEDGEAILKKFGLNNDKFITLQVGTGGLKGARNVPTDSRVFPLDKYEELVDLLHVRYPNYRIVQLGYQGCDEVPGIDLNLTGKTNFEECLTILDAATLHIDGECGLVHMRHFISCKPSVVIYGPTMRKFYSYPENINISSTICTTCEWLHRNWGKICLRTGGKPLCLQQLDVKMIFEQIVESKILDL